ncbi:MAG: trypsin-like peptidase domain-containing protein [Oscillospiraceae bacterium]|nr:trypsin-like peptidase domain-containing protein [Oscillospiraceae bacterium]
MKYCPFCGFGLRDEMIFCPKCGKCFPNVLEDKRGTDSIRADSKREMQEAVVTQVSVDAAAVQTVKRSFKPMIWLVLTLAAVSVAVGVFFGTGESEDTISITDAANSVLYLEVFDDIDCLIATASGFIIEDGTTLVTNYHVIDGAHHIVAYTPDGKSSVEVNTILAFDEDSDLAVLKCRKPSGVTPLLLGDSDMVMQGDEVYAVGYPLGVANTLSDGVISSRYVNEANVDILQITAAISSGSSGGALFGADGQVIGVICSSYVDGQNLNLAIASNCVKSLLENRQEMSMEKFYEASDPIRTVKNILRNRNELDGKYSYVQGYVSSAFAYSAGDSKVIDYYLVVAPEEIYGMNYSDKVYDPNEFIALMRKENQRCLQGGAICFEVDWSDRFGILPGDYVVLYGEVMAFSDGSVFMDNCVLIA